MDLYLKWLDSSIKELEDILGINQPIGDDKKVSDLDMAAIAAHVQKEISSSKIEQRTVQVFSTIGFLAHLLMRMDFFHHLRLDYRNFPMKKEIMQSLVVFTKEKELTPELRNQANVVASVLDRIDKKHLDLRYSLAYRYLRISLVLLLHSCYAHLSVVSKLIISQIERGNENVGPDKQFHSGDREGGQTQPIDHSG